MSAPQNGNKSFRERLEETARPKSPAHSQLQTNVNIGLERTQNPAQLYRFQNPANLTIHGKPIQPGKAAKRLRDATTHRPLFETAPEDEEVVTPAAGCDEREIQLVRMIQAASRRPRDATITKAVAPDDEDIVNGLHTAEDAVAFFSANNCRTCVKFLLLNRAPRTLDFRPYDLVVVPKGSEDPEHYVMSNTGVVHVRPGAPSDVVSLADWMREASLFTILRKIPFFRNYLLHKAFFRLHQKLRERKFAAKRKVLSRELLLSKPTFASAQMDLLKTAHDFQTAAMMWYEPQGKHDYFVDDFRSAQSNQRQQAAEVANETAERIEGKVSKLISTLQRRADVPDLNTREALEQYLLASDAANDGVKYLSQRKAKSMLEAKEEQYQKMRELKRSIVEYGKADVFIRLADLMNSENMYRNVLHTLQAFFNTLRRQSTEETRVVGFQVLLQPTASEIRFNPERTVVEAACAEIFAGCTDLAAAMSRLCDQKYFKAYFPRIPRIWNIATELRHDARLSFLHESVHQIIANDYEQAYGRMDCYSTTLSHIHFLQKDWSTIEAEWKDENGEEVLSCMSLAKLYRRLQEAQDALRVLMASFVGNTLWINATRLKTEIEPRMHVIRNGIDNTLRATTTDVVKTLHTFFKQKTQLLNERPQTLNDFAEYIAEYKGIVAVSEQTEATVAQAEALCDLMDRHQVEFLEDEEKQLKERTLGSNSSSSAISLRVVFDEARLHAEEFIEEHLPEHIDVLQSNVVNVEDECLSIQQILAGEEFIVLSDNTEPVLQYLEDIHAKLTEVEESQEQLTRYATLFDQPPFDWAFVADVLAIYEVRQEMWTLLDTFNKRIGYWFDVPLRELDTADMEDQVNNMVRRAGAVNRTVQERGYSDELGTYLLDELMAIRVNMPVIHDCGNKHMSADHWNIVLKEMTGSAYSYHDALNLRALQEHDVFAYKEALAEQAGLATGEWKINNDLDVIKQIWNEVAFGTKPYKNREGVFILDGLEDIVQQLDDHQIELQTIMASRFVAPVREKVETWIAKLRLISTVIEEWVTLQKNWMYLEFIFSSDDIKEQLPAESEQFDKVDSFFRSLTSKAHTVKNVLVICTEEGVLDELKESNDNIDHIQKKLEDYLETKRIAFPRFYFLSNDELLSILSDVRNPKAVQPHLSKCFDSIASLIFSDEECSEIVGMKSGEGEVVTFESPVYPVGSIEMWLNDIETMMKQSLLMHMRETITAYPQRKRETWFFEHPSQCIQAADMVFWTGEVEDAIMNSELEQYYGQYQQQILRMVDLVKTSLSKLERTLVCTLIVLNVHSRDIVHTLNSEAVSDLGDFSWFQQLRYYWETDPRLRSAGRDASADESMTMNVGIRHCNAHLWYGYEYLGNQPRLVITPLTDRAFLTCTSALAMNLGAAPQGPAGTGKTESVKDLGKALARQVVVFNCSDGINYKTMSRMFAGLAQAGAWACFDEFNRIELEVLSVIAQQMLEITTALSQKLESMTFDGHPIRLSKNFGVFITMNPGYAGRTELPDNLKALFRPICMMIPDYALIAEIMFYSEGFADARTLAQKMVQLYKLSSEQLSKQDHYDFGMRAVKSILVMAGALKRENPDENEDMLLIRAMRDANVPKFLRDDTILFMALVKDLFPTVAIEEKTNAMLVEYIQRQMTETGLQVVEGMVGKALQLYDTLEVRHGVMMVGQTYSGKSTIVTTVQNALTRIYEDGHNKDGSAKPLFNRVHTHILNPKSVTMGELYGQVNEITREWTDGILSDIARNVTRAALTQPDRQWVVFDGPVDAVWIENMNTVLDDNKLLCLFNGERIKLPSTATFMFEVQDLKVASPATVSRCGMVYVEPYYLDGNRGWVPIAKSLVEKKTTVTPSMRGDRLMELLQELLPEALDFVRAHCKEWIPSVDAQLAVNCIELLDGFMKTCPKTVPQKDGTAGAAGNQTEGNAASPAAKKGKKKMSLLDATAAATAAGAGRRRSSAAAAAIAGEVVPPVQLWPRAALRPIEQADEDAAENGEEAQLMPSAAGTQQLGAGTAAGRQRTSSVGAMVDENYEPPEAFRAPAITAATAAEPDDARLFDMYFVMAFIWSVGGNLRDDARGKFNAFLKEKLAQSMPHVANAFPSDVVGERVSVYDYVVHRPSMQFITWNHLVPNFQFRRNVSYFDLIVPTAETVALKTLLGILTSTSQHVLVNGVTGTGKSLSMLDFMRSTLHGDDPASQWEYLTTVLSAQSRSKDIEDRLESKLYKVRSNVLGPTPGKRAVFFVDDLNMPALEKYGASPPLELLRQLITQGGFFDKHKTPATFKELHDIVFLAACGVPGGGRNEMTQRLTSRFHLLCQPTVANENMERIFGSILYGFLRRWNDEDITSLTMKLIAATRECYERITREKLPTPRCSHYTFNLRDFSKVIQGVMQVSPKSAPAREDLCKVFAHEVTRTFHDRLVDDTDRQWWWQTLEAVTTKELGMQWGDSEAAAGGAAVNYRDMLFGDYMRRDRAHYEEITDMALVQEAFQEYQSGFNMEYNKEVELVFFKDAIQHVSRICRILRQPRGNALLAGMGGTGRQSLCKLAAFMCNLPIYDVTITRNFSMADFRESMKKVLLDSGCHDKPVLFYMSDAQIVYEEMLEDVNNLLNTGEIPNLMQQEDVDAIVEAVRPLATAAGKQETRNVIFSHFVSLCRDHVHVVLAMSPIGEQFRRRLRMFPSLVNCCTIDWFDQWPADALRSVASRVFANVGNIDEAMKDRLIQLCVTIHMDVQTRSEEFYEELRRRNYTTPTSYLELLNCYRSLLEEQQKNVAAQVNRYQGGLDTLRSTQELVDEMKVALVGMQPQLIQAAKDTAEIMEKVEREQASAEVVRRECAQEEEVASAIQAEADGIRTECQVELDKAMPILKAAEDALADLKPDDIREVRSFLKPASRVVLVLEAVLTLLGEKDVSWDRAKLVMGRMDFIKDLQNYPRDDLTEKMIKSIQKYVNNPDFQPDEVAKSSKACRSLSLWVLAINNYYEVVKIVAPKRARLAEAEAKVAIANKALTEARGRLQEIENKLNTLRREMQENILKKKQLENDIDLATVRLERAEQLMSGLASEQTRWVASIRTLEAERGSHMGRMALAAGFVAYLGPFTAPYRARMVSAWHAEATSLQLPMGDDASFSLPSIVDPISIRTWGQKGLPPDPFSTENGVIVTKSKRWCLCIDPQGQAVNWIRMMERDNNLRVIKLSEPSYMRTLENAIRVGLPVLIENVEESLDAALDPVLMRQTYRSQGRLLIKLGDSEIDYDPNFRLYITTKLANPHYLPELQIKVTIVNFTVTNAGLENQLLADVVRFEYAELEHRATKTIMDIANGKKQLKDIEDKILQLLLSSSSSSGAGDDKSILDNEPLIRALQEAKSTSESVSQSLAVSEETQKDIDAARMRYNPVAARGATIYGVLSEVSGLDHMYQNSLDFFKQLFNQTLRRTERRENVDERVALLLPAVTLSSYTTICRGLFERDKLVFAFLLFAHISRQEGTITDAEWAFMLKGSEGRVFADEEVDPPPSWMSAVPWNELSALSEVLPRPFAGLKDDLYDHEEGWQAWFASEKAYEHFPAYLDANGFTLWQKMVVLKALREDLLNHGLLLLIGESLGKPFTESPAFDLEGCFQDSTPTAPIIFVLTPGTDPTQLFTEFAERKGFGARKLMLSLGQDQGSKAEQMIRTASAEGMWVYLQNCHVYASWMPSLERILEELTHAEVHRDFRLWLTTMPTASFPVLLLQSGVKVVKEPPKGLKANIRDTFSVEVSEDLWNSCPQNPTTWRRLVFSLGYFHAVTQERRKFGPLGWNIPYEWNQSDFAASIQSLLTYLPDEEPTGAEGAADAAGKGGSGAAGAGAVPWSALRYMIGVINYGGRVTDFLDTRCLNTLLAGFFNEEVTRPGQQFNLTADGVYCIPEEVGSLSHIRDYLADLPPFESPELFGLHANADVTFNRTTVRNELAAILSVQPRAKAAAGEAPEEKVLKVVSEFEARLPPLIDKTKGHPDTYHITEDGTMTSLGTVAGQEVDVFNGIVTKLARTLAELKRGIKGEVVMSAQLEAMFDAMLLGHVPQLWHDGGYLSRKPLASWFQDTLQRVEFFRDWNDNGLPMSFWLSGFFFPQGFLTAVLQQYSRANKIPIDDVKLKTNVTRCELPDDLEEEVEAGVYVHGLFLEGARYDMDAAAATTAAGGADTSLDGVDAAQAHGCLVESRKGELFTRMPVTHLEPVRRNVATATAATYACPVYKTSARVGTLSTTGLSTNFVVSLDLGCAQGTTPDHWIRRGVALLCMLDD